MELIIVGVVAALSFLSYALWRRGQGESPGPALPPAGAPLRLGAPEPSPSSLRPGDVVSHGGRDYLVEGLLTLDDDGRVTRLYRMMDGARTRWLAVRPGDDEALLLDAVAGLLEGGVAETAPDQLTLEGAAYRLLARVPARVGRSGAVGGLPAGERAWLSEYAGAGPRRILALASGERTDTFAGEPVARGLLDILPGS